MTEPRFELTDDLFTPKEVSWLAFNERLLQEAEDLSVPLIDRLKFLGIYSSNLDEFFRVRVATLRRLAGLGFRSREFIRHDPKQVLDQVMREAKRQHARYNALYEQLIVELGEHGIHMIDELAYDEQQASFVEAYFHKIVRHRLHPIMIRGRGDLPPLVDQAIYLAVRLSDSRGKRKPRYALMGIPTDVLNRFVVLPSRNEEHDLTYLDDVIRYNLGSVFSLFPHDTHDAYMVKFAKDAELDLDDDIQESYFSRISRSIKRRGFGSPVRFLYDGSMPDDMLDLLLTKLKIPRDESLTPGARYHHRSDLMNFPTVGKGSLASPERPAVAHPDLPTDGNYLRAVRRRDVLLHFPYHSFDHVLTLLREAALDPKVRSIQICLYRLARNSSVVNALINALRNGKQVTVVMELQARFDEEANLLWSARLREEGARVIMGVPGLKVHAKLILVTRRERGADRDYACIGTGNMNEDTGRVFSDFMLLTASEDVAGEIRAVFDQIRKPYRTGAFQHLLVSPYNLREGVVKKIDREIELAKAGRDAWMDVKLNNLSDEAVISRLYEASQAGVSIRLNIRGMYSIKAGVDGVSTNIQAMGIIDRFLEHSRVLVFGNDGNTEVWLGSADWLPRNFDKRIEVMVPLRNPKLVTQVRTIIEAHWRDNTKARILDPDLSNAFRRDDKPPFRVQDEIYDILDENT